MAALPLPCALWFLDRVKGRDGCPQPSAKRSTYQQLAADMSPTFRTASAQRVPPGVSLVDRNALCIRFMNGCQFHVVKNRSTSPKLWLDLLSCLAISL